MGLLEKYWVLGSISFITFISTILLLPFLIINMREDYFVHENSFQLRELKKRPFYILVLLLKNILGLLILLMGIVMLFVPGQGILTILIGLSLMNFPGKRKLEIRLATHQTIYKTLNWIRKKWDKEPFLYPHN